MEKHFHHKDEAPKMTNEQVVSIVDNDFILNFLNEYDHHPNKKYFKIKKTSKKPLNILF